MCLKNVLFMVLVYIAVHPGVKAADKIIVPEEFKKILGNFILQYHKDNATDVCKTPVEKHITVNFTKSILYERFKLEKYFADKSKCENLCLKVDYEFTENGEKINDFGNITTVTEITVTPTDEISTNPTLPILKDGNSPATSTETATLEGTMPERGSGTAKQTKQEIEGGNKTAIIVASTVVAVGATTVASYFVVNWISTLLKSGTYVFPHNP